MFIQPKVLLAGTAACCACGSADGSIIASSEGYNTLDLGSYSKITNEGLKYLTKVHTLYLGDDSKITDEGLKYLTNVHVLFLGHCPQITDDGLKQLEHTILHYH
jgi:hypothetical protein